jgi:hypothetical protein
MCSSICNQIRAVFASIGTGFSQLAHRISALVRGLFTCMGCSAREAAPLNPQRVSSPYSASAPITDAIARPVLDPHTSAANFDVPMQPQSASSPAAFKPLFSFSPNMGNFTPWIHLEHQQHCLTTAATENFEQLENWEGSSEDFLNHIDQLAQTFEMCNGAITKFYDTHISSNQDHVTKKWKQGPKGKLVDSYILKDLIRLDTFRAYHQFWSQLKAFDRAEDLNLADLKTFIKMPLPEHLPHGLAQTIGQDIKVGLFEFILKCYTWMLENKIDEADDLKKRIENLFSLLGISTPVIPSYAHIVHLKTFYAHLSAVANPRNNLGVKIGKISEIKTLEEDFTSYLYKNGGLCQAIFGRLFALGVEDFANQVGDNCPDDLVPFVSTLCHNLSSWDRAQEGSETV